MRMKFKIFNNSKKNEEVFFKLEEYFDTVKLAACDSEGNTLPDSDILSIQTDGTLRIFPYVNPTLGLKLDNKGRIIIDND